MAREALKMIHHQVTNVSAKAIRRQHVESLVEILRNNQSVYIVYRFLVVKPKVLRLLQLSSVRAELNFDSQRNENYLFKALLWWYGALRHEVIALFPIDLSVDADDAARQIMNEFTRNSSSLLFNAAVNTNESSHNVTHSSSLVQHFVVCCLKCKWATEQCYNLNKIGIFNFLNFFLVRFPQQVHSSGNCV